MMRVVSKCGIKLIIGQFISWSISVEMNIAKIERPLLFVFLNTHFLGNLQVPR